IEIPDKVRVSVDNDGAVSVEGPRGKLNWKLPRDIRATVKDNGVSIMREAETRSVKALHGLSRSLVHNMVQGVSQGFTKQLEIEGVGFKAAVQGPTLTLSLALSLLLFILRFQRTSRSLSLMLPRLTSKVWTKNWWARWRQIFAVFTRQNHTRAKVCAMPASRFVARKARQSNKYGDDS